MKYHLVILLIFIVEFTSCTEKVNYNNHDLEIISEKIYGVWVDKETLTDTVLLFTEKNENNTGLTGVMSNDFEITERGFKTAMHQITIKINKVRGNTIFSMYSNYSIDKDFKID